MFQGQPLHLIKYALQILTDASKRPVFTWGNTLQGEPGPFQKQVTHKVSGTKMVFWP